MITKRIANYKEFGQVVIISDGVTEAYITVDIGPRIIRYGFIGEQNMLNDTMHSTEEKTGGAAFDKYYYKGAYWYNYGGMRLWFSPESTPGSYYPDNDPVEYVLTDKGAIFMPMPQKENGVQYKITVEYEKGKLAVTSEITNISKKPKKFAVWALSVSALGGTLIIPQSRTDTGLLHNRQISVWPYTDLRDKRLYLGNKYVTLVQKKIDKAIKIGFNVVDKKVYYALKNTVMTHEIPFVKDALYPDNNINFETYSCKTFTEVEVLSPLKEIAPGESNTLKEYWSLAKTDKKLNPKNEEEIEEYIKSL